MTKSPRSYCYELRGESLAAAKTLYAEVSSAVMKEKPKSSGSLGEIKDSWRDFYRRFVARLQITSPDVLEATGLLMPVVVVRQDAGMYPRAYEKYPHIFLSPEPIPRYFMYAPVGDDGSSFVPADGVLQEGEAANLVDNLLFAGGWLGNAPLVDRPARGVAVPQCYKASRLRRAFAGAASYGKREFNYMAFGRSLADVRSYEEEIARYNAALNAAMNAVRAAAEALFPALETKYGADKYHVNMTASFVPPRSNGASNLRFSIYSERNGALPVPESSAFHVVSENGSRMFEYTVIAREDTKEGRGLKKLLDAIPARWPLTADYSSLVVNGQAPTIVTHGQHKILRYFVPADVRMGKAAPADSKPVPAAVYRWLMNDASDRAEGVEPPPPPGEVMAWLTSPLRGDSTLKGHQGSTKRR